VRKIIHPMVYLLVALSYIVMEIFIKCKAAMPNLDPNTGQTNLNRSQPVSISIAASFILHTASDFIVPKLIKGPEYFAAKILISNFLFYIFVPSIIIWFNPKIHNYVEQQIRSKFPKIQRPLNQVSPAVSIA
jgi:hypothetical protein